MKRACGHSKQLRRRLPRPRGDSPQDWACRSARSLSSRSGHSREERRALRHRILPDRWDGWIWWVRAGWSNSVRAGWEQAYHAHDMHCLGSCTRIQSYPIYLVQEGYLYDKRIEGRGPRLRIKSEQQGRAALRPRGHLSLRNSGIWKRPLWMVGCLVG